MNQIIQKAVEELQGHLRNWAIVEPETTLILGNVRRLLTEAYMAGRSDVVEFIRETCLRTGSAESFKFVEGKLKAEGVKLGDYVVSEEFLEQAKQPVKDNN